MATTERVVLEFEARTRGLQRALQQLNRRLDNIDATVNIDVESDGAAAAGENVEKLTTAFDELELRLEAAEKRLEDVDKQTEKTSESTSTLTTRITSAVEGFTIFGVRVGAAIVQTAAFARAQLSAAAASLGLSRNLRLVGKAFGTGVLAVITAGVAAIGAFLNRVQGGQDIILTVTTAIGLAFDDLAIRGGALIDVFTNLANFDFGAARDSAQRAFGGIGDSYERIRRETEQIVDSQIELEETITNNRVAIERLQTQVELLRNVAEDINRPFEERIEAAERAVELLGQQLALEEQNAEAAVRRAQADVDSANTTREELDALAEAEAELFRVRAQNATQLRELQNRINGLRKEELDLQKQLFDQAREIAAEFQGTDAILNLEREIENIDALIANIERVGGAGLSQLPALRAFRETLFAALDDLFDRPNEISSLLTEPIQGLDGDLSVLNETLRDNAFFTEFAKQQAEEFAESQRNAKDAVIESNAEIAAQAERFTTELGTFIGTLGQLYATAAQRNGELIDASRQRLNELVAAEENASAEQIRLERERLRALEREQQRYIRRQQALAQIEIGINQGIAVSNLVKGILQNFGRDGNAIAGALQVASLLALIGTSIAAANSAFQGFARGTEYVDGAGTSTSDSILARLSRGERVLTARQNAQLGGRAMSNDELVKFAQYGMRATAMPVVGGQGFDTELREKLERNNELLQTLIARVEKQHVTFNITESGIYGAVQRMRAREIKRDKLRK